MAIMAARYNSSTFFKVKAVSLSLPMYRLRVYGSNKHSHNASLSVSLQSITLMYNKAEFGSRCFTQLVTIGRIR